MRLIHNVYKPSTSQDIHWVGSTNELNASYAADVSLLIRIRFDISG
jgi:TPP-dependent 2-oxoacid decarboxylase